MSASLVKKALELAEVPRDNGIGPQLKKNAKGKTVVANSSLRVGVGIRKKKARAVQLQNRTKKATVENFTVEEPKDHYVQNVRYLEKSMKQAKKELVQKALERRLEVIQKGKTPKAQKKADNSYDSDDEDYGF